MTASFDETIKQWRDAKVADLRNRLIAASLVFTVDGNGLKRDVRTDEDAAAVALAIVIEWWENNNLKGAGYNDDFYEEDEPLEHVLKAWNKGEKHLTTPPPKKGTTPKKASPKKVR